MLRVYARSIAESLRMSPLGNGYPYMMITTGSGVSKTSMRAGWWIPLARGIVSIAFGAVIFAFPISAIGIFVLLFGAYAAFDGVLTIVQALRSARPRSTRWWSHLVAGLAGIVVGGLTFAWPSITAFTLAIFICSWAIVTGILEIVAGFQLRNDVRGELFTILAGVFSVGLGVVVFFFPLAALLSWVWLIGAYAILAGVALIVLAFRLRGGGYSGTKPR